MDKGCRRCSSFSQISYFSSLFLFMWVFLIMDPWNIATLYTTVGHTGTKVEWTKYPTILHYFPKPVNIFSYRKFILNYIQVSKIRNNLTSRINYLFSVQEIILVDQKFWYQENLVSEIHSSFQR